MKKLILFLSVLAATVNAPAQYAPESIDGAVLTAQVTSGNGWFASWGSYQATFLSNSYTITKIENIENSSGSYTYTKTGANTATLTIIDSLAGLAVSQLIVFTSSNTGSYSLISSFGSQTANFTFTLPNKEPTETIGADWVYMRDFPWIYVAGKGWYYAFADPFWMKSSSGQNWIEIN